MLTSIVIALALALIALLFVAALKPDDYRFERGIDIAAPPERVFPLIADLRAMNSWNPFATDDPTSSFTYTGPPSGAGARYDWAGGKMGSGSFEVREAHSPRRVAAALTMLKPVLSENDVVFTLAPQGTGTRVTWSIAGKRRLVHKLMHTVMNPDRMMGGMFDKGLAALKAKAEA